MSKFEITSWRKFQHYHSLKTPPPWIKLYASTINSEDWIGLNDSGKLLMVSLLMLGCRTEGVVSGDVTYLRKVLNLQRTPNLDPLFKCGFLKPLEETLDSSYSDSRLSLVQSREEESREEKICQVEHLAGTILKYLNRTTNRKFLAKPASLDPIKARLKDGATEAECQGVIKLKWEQWKDDIEMIAFVCPSTLFRKSNFQKYVAEMEAGPASPRAPIIDHFPEEFDMTDQERKLTEEYLNQIKK